ncbi:MAG: CbbQ/NirQ/NorQ/GpvN family protein [Candidatus Pacebacteria bacterium]|nr:CbbQ/NirQ/NorQ/GpvN family protein [Candidatus Paceibacterota bacterium]
MANKTDTKKATTRQKQPDIVRQFLVEEPPHYVEVAQEKEFFLGSFRQQLPLLMKGPTGCGKTRFVERMAYELSLPLITVSCHEDLSAADLVGRYLFKDNQTVWEDGPLTLAVRYGGICYLDEIVEARNDTTVIIHSLTDHRRILYIDKTQEVVHAHPNFMMAISYNPGYQNITKDLKESTKQRFCAITFQYPPVDMEARIVAEEADLDKKTAQTLADMAVKIRNLKGYGLSEGVSTRLLVYAGKLIAAGIEPNAACGVTIADVLTDDVEISDSIIDVINLYFPKPENAPPTHT